MRFYRAIVIVVLEVIWGGHKLNKQINKYYGRITAQTPVQVKIDQVVSLTLHLFLTVKK